MKASKAFIKPFEAPQRSVKIKILLNFFSSFGIGTGRVKLSGHCSTLLQYFIALKLVSLTACFKSYNVLFYLLLVIRANVTCLMKILNSEPN